MAGTQAQNNGSRLVVNVERRSQRREKLKTMTRTAPLWHPGIQPWSVRGMPGPSVRRACQLAIVPFWEICLWIRRINCLVALYLAWCLGSACWCIPVSVTTTATDRSGRCWLIGLVVPRVVKDKVFLVDSDGQRYHSRTPSGSLWSMSREASWWELQPRFRGHPTIVG